jgi:hypothetical protein
MIRLLREHRADPARDRAYHATCAGCVGQPEEHRLISWLKDDEFAGT